MCRHDSVHGADELAADEDDRDGGGAAGTEEAGEGALHVGATWVLVELVDGGVDPHAAKEALDGVAHAARAHAEDDDGVLGGQPLDALQRVDVHVGAAAAGAAAGGGGGDGGHVGGPRRLGSCRLIMHFCVKEIESFLWWFS